MEDKQLNHSCTDNKTYDPLYGCAGAPLHMSGQEITRLHVFQSYCQYIYQYSAHIQVHASHIKERNKASKQLVTKKHYQNTL